MSKITTAVIAAAGLGTRFFPAVKVVPKEMLPIVDKPIIQYLAEEAVLSGIKRIIIVVRGKQSLMERHFNKDEFNPGLSEKKRKLLESVQQLVDSAEFVFVSQDEDLPYGNASPIIAAKEHLVGEEAFVYMFGDDMTIANVPVTRQLMDLYDAYTPAGILAVQKMPDEELYRYGTVKYKAKPKFPHEIELGVEKAPKGEAPSNMVQFGRFVFTKEVIKEAEKKQTGKDGELWVIDILNALAKQGKSVLALPIKGRWLTTGDPLRYLQTAISFALEREDLREDLKNFLKKNL